MKTRFLALLLTGALLGPATAAFADDHKHCDGDAEVCLKEMVRNLKKRGWVGIELEMSSQNGTPKVTNVLPESPARRAGLEVGDRLVALNGVAYERSNQQQLKKIYSAMVPGMRIVYTVERGERQLEVPIELATLPSAVMQQWVGQHMILHAEQALADEQAKDDEDGEAPK